MADIEPLSDEKLIDLVIWSDQKIIRWNQMLSHFVSNYKTRLSSNQLNIVEIEMTTFANMSN